ncbi:MAG: hypothetical protein CL537_15455 [Alcanivoracaceae bacterium]|nr:hypothetical protein [Alcanivoracaceae bacterium]|tara:strand:- start:4896 stop:5684 length:789 start_codon:yes stop_codon:yes gene_type:complete
MKEHTSSKRQGEYLSRIALALSERPTLQGTPPDDEDMAALLDNLLDPQRRAEVISHLAHDPALYRRWHRLLNDQDLWVEHNNALNLSSAARKPRRWWQPAGGLTAAAAALFAGWLALKPGMDPLTLDQAYQQFSPELSSYLDEQPNMRDLPVAQDDDINEILAGIHDGQQSQGVLSSFAGIGKAQLALASEHYRQQFGEQLTVRHEWGRWLLLSDALCNTAPDKLEQLTRPADIDGFAPLPESVSCDDVTTQRNELQQRLTR